MKIFFRQTFRFIVGTRYIMWKTEIVLFLNDCLNAVFERNAPPRVILATKTPAPPLTENLKERHHALSKYHSNRTSFTL